LPVIEPLLMYYENDWNKSTRHSKQTIYRLRKENQNYFTEPKQCSCAIRHDHNLQYIEKENIANN
jgi:hypothetical protein